METGQRTSKKLAGPRGVIVLLLAAAVILAGVFLAIRSGPPPESLPELAREDLERHDDGLRIRESGTLFSGYMVARYPDGAVRSRSRVVEGRLHGVSEGWYPDGTPEISEHFRDGVSHGVRVRWHPNGETASRAEIEDGEIHGVFRRWDENGVLLQVIAMRNGLPHGVSKAYFPSGFLQTRAELDRGHVVNQEFWDDLEMRDETR